MARSPKSVRRLLKDKPALRLLELEISAQKALLNRVRQLLPEELARHCLAAREREQQLILHTDSPVWATRLRFHAPKLVSRLKPSHPSLRGIKIRLHPTRPMDRRRLPPARHSDAASTIIHDCATDTNRAELSEALERLSIALKEQ